jgi:hypothetical protein
MSFFQQPAQLYSALAHYIVSGLSFFANNP